MQPAGAREAGIEGGVQHALALAQKLLGVAHREVGQELLGTDAGPAHEKALEMIFAQAHGGRDSGQFGLLQAVLGDKVDGGGNALVILAGGRHEYSPGLCSWL